MRRLIASFAFTGLLLASTAVAAAPAIAPGQPGAVFARPSPLFLHAPQFDKITEADFQPAMAAGRAEQLAEIEKIAANPAPPTFDNTIVALARSGEMLGRVSAVFSSLTQANTTPGLQKIQAAEGPKGAAHRDAILLNARLFARIETLYNQRAGLKLTPEGRQLLKVTYEEFVRSGAKLPPADQQKLRTINGQLSSLQIAFQQKLLAGARAASPVIEDRAKLAGLTDNQIAALAQAAKARGLDGKFVIPVQNTTLQPLFLDLADRGTRQQLFDAGWTRNERGDANDTRDTLVQIAQLRAQKAALLGRKTWADYSLETQMAENPATVEKFLAELTGPTRRRAAAEAADIQKVIDAEGQHFDLKPYDWDRYAEKVRQARFNLSDAETKPYFELDRVLVDGVLYAANQLYGVTFKKRTDIPVYDPDIRVFEVHDKDGSILGLFYFDYFKRDNKAGGAWNSSYVQQAKLTGAKPVVYNVANFTKPAAGQPALISFDDVTTMFHEFGHGLNALFNAQGYPGGFGGGLARDFVEYPSQFNENWALEPRILSHYAVHYQTGAPIPQSLVAKIKASGRFNQGYAMGEAIAASQLDMKWHTLPAGAPKPDVDAFEAEALKSAGVDFPNVPPRYRSSYFLHIFSNGYAAGYYAYSWTKMLADDTFAWFTAHGGLTRENGQRYRDLILSKGHTEDYAPMFRAFYGKDPDIGPMLEHRGLTGDRD